MTFEFAGTAKTFPSVPPVPITWAGTSFTGRLEEAGPGEDITYQASGAVSKDGDTLLSLAYSRQVIRPSANSGVFYRVTLQNVPVVNAADGAANGPGKFEKAGAELQNYVVNIEYADGPLSGGRIAPNTTYVSTDWTNTGTGQTPTLKLAFGK